LEFLASRKVISAIQKISNLKFQIKTLKTQITITGKQ